MSSVKINFIPDRPCVTVEEHIGREDPLKRTFHRLSSDNVQSTVIIGAPKFGKTSFVNYLQQPTVIRQHLGEKSEQYIFVCIHLEKTVLNNEKEFFSEVFKQIENVLQNVLPRISKLKEPSDTDIITAWLKKNNKRLVLILDDFHLIVTNPNYKQPFFNAIRSWGYNSGCVGYVFTSFFEIESLPGIPKELEGSPFFNIFECYHLGPLTLLEAATLLEARLPRQLRKHPEEILEIIRQVGFNPYELQMAGFHWSSYFTRYKEIHQEKLLDQIRPELHSHYESFYHSALNDKQRESIKLLLKASSKAKEINNKLIENGWVGKHSGKFTAVQMERFFQEKFGSKKTGFLPTWMSSKTK